MNQPLWIILHVPKTAGQTVQRHLLDHMPEGSVWVPGPHPAPWGVRPIAAPPQPDRIRAVVGHDAGCSLERHFPDRDIRRVALLRDPVGFHASLYNFRMMNRIRTQRPVLNLDAYLARTPRDPIARFLLTRWLEIPWPAALAMSAGEAFARLNAALTEFHWVSSFREVDAMIAAAAPELGIPIEARRRNASSQWARRAQGFRPVKAGELDPAIRDRILAENAVDAALWTTWRDARLAASAVVPGAAPRPGQGALIHEARRGVLAALEAAADLLRPSREPLWP